MFVNQVIEHDRMTVQPFTNARVEAEGRRLARVGPFRKSRVYRVGRVGARPVVGREVGVFHHGQNPPPFGVGDDPHYHLDKTLFP